MAVCNPSLSEIRNKAQIQWKIKARPYQHKDIYHSTFTKENNQLKWKIRTWHTSRRDISMWLITEPFWSTVYFNVALDIFFLLFTNSGVSFPKSLIHFKQPNSRKSLLKKNAHSYLLKKCLPCSWNILKPLPICSQGNIWNACLVKAFTWNCILILSKQDCWHLLRFYCKARIGPSELTVYIAACAELKTYLCGKITHTEKNPLFGTVCAFPGSRKDPF